MWGAETVAEHGLTLAHSSGCYSVAFAALGRGPVKRS
jgi:hypothetical protein